MWKWSKAKMKFRPWKFHIILEAISMFLSKSNKNGKYCNIRGDCSRTTTSGEVGIVAIGRPTSPSRVRCYFFFGKVSDSGWYTLPTYTVMSIWLHSTAHYHQPNKRKYYALHSHRSGLCGERGVTEGLNRNMTWSRQRLCSNTTIDSDCGNVQEFQGGWFVRLVNGPMRTDVTLTSYFNP